MQLRRERLTTRHHNESLDSRNHRQGNKTSNHLESNFRVFADQMSASYDNMNVFQPDNSVTTMEATEDTHTNTTEPSSTDLLFSLPPELLLPIFSSVGAHNFRQDVRRLAVCKGWYAYARPVFLSSLVLHTRGVGLLPKLLTLDEGATLAAAQQLTTHIDLRLFADGRFPLPPGLPFATRTALGELSSKLQDFASLRKLSICTEGFAGTMPTDIPNEIITPFAALNQLTSLELDLANTIAFSDPTQHLCKHLSQLIPNLKRLQCRLPRTCHELLDSPPGNLEELIISISFRKGDDSRFYPRYCSYKPGHLEHDSGYQAVRINLEAELLRFARSMNSPKTVRLIHNRRFGGHRVFAFDAIQNRRLRLRSSSAWDSEGVVVGDDWWK